MKNQPKDEIAPTGTTLKTYFITGLVILLPLALTSAIVIFIVNLLTDPFVGIVKSVLDHYNFLTNGFLFLSADQVQQYSSQVIILLLLFFATVGLGSLARWFFFHYLISFWERLVARIPFIRSVYKTCQDVIGTLFRSSSNSFKQVVLVPYPSEQTKAIGLVTRENISLEGTNTTMVAVFIPTTPNPTSGFLILFKPESILYLDMKVEDALKYVISCGVIPTPIKVISEKSQP